jgi:hypothetical protein
MPTALTVLLTLAGVGLIVGAVRDIFDALFHQGARGALSRSLMRGTWWVFHRLSRLRGGLLPVAGPIMLVVIVATWATLLALGWALIFWPHMPEGFLFSSTPGDRASAQFLDALYISLVTLGTIGFGDITPLEGWLRLVAPLEALLGFGLLTGSISWLLSIYPTLLRRRSLTYEIALLRKAEEERGLGVSGLRPEAAEGLYAELKSRLVAVERDLVTFPISYYFSSADERFALSRSMPYLLELAERGDDDANPPGVRLRTILLREAIDDFARSTAARFHGHSSDSTAELLHAYARDHMRESGDGAKRTSGGG